MNNFLIWKLKGICVRIRIMEIVEIKNQKEWEDNSQFLQSWLWGDFQTKIGDVKYGVGQLKRTKRRLFKL